MQEVLLGCLSKFKSKRCRTCPKLAIKSFFYSNITCKKTFIINPSLENINCNTNNIIYLLTSEDCGTWYVRETTNELYIRMDLRRT